jgi:hypothetical protein
MRVSALSRVSLSIVVVLTALGLLRALLLWSHDPLYAYANSYDQTRYSACFNIYPDRPAEIAPDQNSPQAPYEQFRFIATGDPMCYWSSELVFGALTAATWRISEAFGADAQHSVRVIGAFKLAALLILSIAFSRAWLRREHGTAAIANAALLPLLFADPGNALYLNTFYAEWTALLASYALLGLVVLWHREPVSRARFITIALVALLLATSKIQHLLLPLSLAITLLILHRWRSGRSGWLAIALLFGAFLGGYFQFVQLQREGLMMDSIRQYNRADVVFTALLPLVPDRRAFLEEIGVDPDCAEHSGKHAWELPDMPEKACRGVSGFGYAKQLQVLLTHPLMSLRLAGRAVLALDPWIAENIGQVEGEERGEIPPSMFTLGSPLHAYPILQLSVLALPLLGLIVLSVRRGRRGSEIEIDTTALICVAMLAILAITVLGDGLADTAKQGHLVINAALAWLIVAIITRVFAERGAAI